EKIFADPNRDNAGLPQRTGKSEHPRSEERLLEEGRDRRRRLQLNVPLRTANVWTNRVVLNLQLEQRRQASAFAHLAHLWPHPKGPSLTSARLPIDRKGRLRP